MGMISDAERQEKALEAVSYLISMEEIKGEYQLQSALHDIGKIMCEELVQEEGMTDRKRRRIERSLKFQTLTDE